MLIFVLISLFATILIVVLFFVASYAYGSGNVIQNYILEAIMVTLFLSAISFPVVLLLLMWIGGNIIAARLRKAYAFMMHRRLPWDIKTDDDIFALAMRYGCNSVTKYNKLHKLRVFIEPAEPLYYVGLVFADFHSVSGPIITANARWMFISDKRILFQDKDEAFSFLLSYIVSLAVYDEKIVFRTDEGTTSITLVNTDESKLKNIMIVFDVFKHAATKAGARLGAEEVLAHDGRDSSHSHTGKAIASVYCDGCGASVNIVSRKASRCEYCGRVIHEGHTRY